MDYDLEQVRKSWQELQQQRPRKQPSNKIKYPLTLALATLGFSFAALLFWRILLVLSTPVLLPISGNRVEVFPFLFFIDFVLLAFMVYAVIRISHCRSAGRAFICSLVIVWLGFNPFFCFPFEPSAVAYFILLLALLSLICIPISQKANEPYCESSQQWLRIDKECNLTRKDALALAATLKDPSIPLPETRQFVGASIIECYTVTIYTVPNGSNSIATGHLNIVLENNLKISDNFVFVLEANEVSKIKNFLHAPINGEVRTRPEQEMSKPVDSTWTVKDFANRPESANPFSAPVNLD